MFIAEMHTQHFTFTAAGDTREEAIKALARGWEAHCRRQHVPSATAIGGEQAIAEYGARTIPIEPGECWRDHDLRLEWEALERFEEALAHFRYAAAELDSAWSASGVPGEILGDTYPEGWLAFEEVALQIDSMKIVPIEQEAAHE